MIRQIRGKVLSISPLDAVIDIAGFGVQVHMSAPEALRIGAEASLATHLAVKQDSMDLYGFTDAADRDLFEKLIDVPGVGPKTALAILRRSPRAALMGAIATRDLAYLTKVAGLGKKSAEKMLVELAEKMDGGSHDDTDTEVFETLVALGYTEREARTAVQAVPREISGKEARLRAALTGASK